MLSKTQRLLLLTVLLLPSCSNSSQPVPGEASGKSDVETTPNAKDAAPPNLNSSPQKPATKSFAMWFADGQTALEDGETDAALSAFIKAIEIDPHSAEAYNARGVAYLRMDKLRPALSDFSKAIELAPNVPKYYANRALAYRDREEYARAAGDLTKAIELEPTSPKWYRERATLYVFMGDKRLADIDFASAKDVEQGKRLTVNIQPEPQIKEKLDESIKNARVLQAPPFGAGTPKDPTWSSLDGFAQQIRELAGNEFKFEEAKSVVFRSTFDQKNMKNVANINWFLARNGIGSPGKYDFDAGEFAMDFMLWQAVYGEMQIGKERTSRVDDSCSLQTIIKVDAKTAQGWRDAIDNGSFSLTIWYRLARVRSASWKQNPKKTVPELVHDIVFDVEVIKYE